MHATQEAELLWGRATQFDEYSKNETILTKCRGAEDISFVYEWIVMKLKRTTRANQAPTNATRKDLLSYTLPVAKLVRDALGWVLKQGGPVWKDYKSLLDRIAQPAGYDAAFPTEEVHGMTGGLPAATVAQQTKDFTELLMGAPRSLKMFVPMLVDMMENRGSWAKHTSGLLSQKEEMTSTFDGIRGAGAQLQGPGQHRRCPLPAGATEGRLRGATIWVS